MRKVLITLVSLILAGGVGFAQNTTTQQAKYNELLKQRRSLLNWQNENPMAPRVVALMKEKEARKIRTQLYENYFNLRQQDVSAFKKELREELKKVKEGKNVPFLTFNQLPVENMKKITRNKNFLIDLLKLYPDNAVLLADSFLTKLFKEDESLETLLVSYLLYLKNYNMDPACANLSNSEKTQLEISYQTGNFPQFYEKLLTFTSLRLDERRKALAKTHVQSLLATSLKF